MISKEILTIIEEGRKIPSNVWRKLSKQERDEVTKLRSKKPKDDCIPWKNDWRFYAINEQIAKDLGSIPYNVIPGVGKTIKLQDWTGGSAPTVSTVEVPNVKEMSVAVLEYINVAGVATQRTDGVNMSATQLYTFVRRANSGARNYEAADLMMYILAMREVYAEYFECKRILGLAQLYSVENHNLPDVLLKALRINADDLRANFSQYRGQLNLLGAKINALAVPKYFKMFDRTVFITSKVFADSTSIRGQFYMFKRSGYYSWSAKASESGSSLQFNRYGNTVGAFSQRLTILTNMLNALFLDDDINTMSGDILKAFGNDNCYQVVETTENYLVMPQYDEDILAQIENSFAYSSAVGGTTFSNDTLHILQANQLIQWKPKMEFTAATGQYRNIITKYFNSHKDDPTYTDNLEWSRLITTMQFTAATANSVTMEIVSCGQELLELYRIYNSSDTNYNQTPVSNVVNTAIASTNYTETMLTMARLQEFDWHPAVYVFNASSSNAVNRWLIPGMDIKKYTVVDDSTWASLHSAAVTAALWADDLYKVKPSN